MKRIADVSTDRGGINHEAGGFIGKCSNEKENPNYTRRRSEETSCFLFTVAANRGPVRR